MRRSRRFLLLLALVPRAGEIRADTLLFRYEGDVLPYAPEGGWVIANSCGRGCSESLEKGHFVLRWDERSDFANYHRTITTIQQPALPSLWAEWRFRSNGPLTGACFGGDGRVAVYFRRVFEVMYLYGNAVTSFSGNDYLYGLDMSQFHTHRFESPDGIRYRLSLDGQIFLETMDGKNLAASYLQMSGEGDCGFPALNEWDYVRYGTLQDGETVTASDPPAGVLDARVHAPLTKFNVTFDLPSYVYVNQIEVATTVAPVPQVIRTQRRETFSDPEAVGLDPNVVEIVLDRPIPMGATTTFTIDDGVAVSIIEYTFVPGDTDGTGHVDLADTAYLQNCFGRNELSGACLAVDLDRNGAVSEGDVGGFNDALAGPTP
jgi:hypothetical protein